MCFGERNKSVRENHAEIWMLNSAKRLDAIAGDAGTQRHFRLVVNDHVPGGDGLCQGLPVEGWLALRGLEKIRQLARAEIRTRQDYGLDGFCLKETAHGCDRLGIELCYGNNFSPCAL